MAQQMNPYTRHRRKKALHAIASNTHTCETVQSLLTNLRQYSRGTLIQELGDFIAHPDRKDQGLFHKTVAATSEAVKETIAGQRRGFQIHKGIPQEKILKALFQALERLKLVERDTTQWNQLWAQRDSIMVCMLASIQGAMFNVGNDNYPAGLYVVPGIPGDVGCIRFNVDFPSEILTGERNVSLSWPIIETKLRAEDWLCVVDPAIPNSTSSIYEAQRIGSEIKLVPVAKMVDPDDLGQRVRPYQKPLAQMFVVGKPPKTPWIPRTPRTPGAT